MSATLILSVYGAVAISTMIGMCVKERINGDVDDGNLNKILFYSVFWPLVLFCYLYMAIIFSPVFVSRFIAKNIVNFINKVKK